MKKVAAFTLFELTVVLALMSTIITIISVSLNRFNEQIKNTSEIHQELNDWFAFRSNLWWELYNSDSIVYRNNELAVFQRASCVSYRVEDNLLERKSNDDWVNTNVEIEDIVIDDNKFSFNFIWKEETMTLSYPKIRRTKEVIDKYFEEIDE